jgi:DNA-binding response OmpR family regulator
VLLVEDDVAIATPLVRALQREHHEVAHVIDGRDVQKFSDQADVIILDLGLPGMDGLDICRALRKDGYRTPIIILSARVEEVDLIIGLDAGADDYVTKPFRTSELMARIRAVMRRMNTPEVLTVGALVVDSTTRMASFQDRPLTLTPKEFELLEMLAKHAPGLVTRETILKEVWQTDWFGASKTVDMHISTLRKKLIEAGARKELIVTVRGSGFRLLRS